MTKARLGFGILMILALLGMFWGDQHLSASYNVQWAPLFFGIVFLLAAGGAYELTRMLRQYGWRVRYWLTVPASAGIVAVVAAGAWRGSSGVWLAGPVPMGGLLAILVLLIVAVLILETVRAGRTGDFETTLGTVCGTMLVPLYSGMLMLPVVAIRFLDEPRSGLLSLVLFLAVCKLSDVGAYVTGKSFGRNKMVPKLSPGKTWEGTAGGLALSIVAGLAIGLPLLGLLWYEALIFAVAVALASIMGDLAESLLKRSCGTKDSGSMVPEFGGVLDIVDSILVSAPVAYLLLLWFGGSH